MNLTSAVFSRNGMLDKLNHHFTRSSSSHSDIYDGFLYKSCSKVGSFFTCSFNISFLWNTDGIPVFKSSKSSLWPMLYTINELPFNDRVKKENILVGGIWYGSSHPNMLLYIPPQLESMNHSTESGVVINDCVTINTIVVLHMWFAS